MEKEAIVISKIKVAGGFFPVIHKTVGKVSRREFVKYGLDRPRLTRPWFDKLEMRLNTSHNDHQHNSKP